MEWRDVLLNGLKVRVFELNGLSVGAALDVGPRVLFFGERDFNLFAVLPEVGFETLDGFWRLYGGHRLWVAPEAMPRTYSIDDGPVEVEVREKRITVTGPLEEKNGIRKRITIEPHGKALRVVHEVENTSRWPLEFAPWAISVLRGGGYALLPLKPGEEGLLPDRHIALWPYTRLNDERLLFLEDCLVVRHRALKKPLKVGTRGSAAAYWVDGFLFVKRVRESGPYPDLGSNIEVYAGETYIELETLGPLRRVEPGEVHFHEELWEVKRMESPLESGVLDEALG